MDLDRLESALSGVFRGRIQRTDPASENKEYEIRTASKQIVTLEFDLRRNGVRLVGPKATVDQLRI